MTNQIATFATRKAAQAIITELDAQIYHLAHGEHSRPEYKVRKMRGEDSFYIHATYGYYAGTFSAKKDGPLDQNSNELYNL